MEEGEEDLKINLESNDILYELHILHYFSVNQKHFLKIKDNFRLFEPTKFVYSYFSFSTIFNYDWSKLLDKKDIVPHQKRKVFFDNGDYKEHEEYEKIKIERYLNFIFDNISSKNRKEFIQKIMNNKTLEEIKKLIDSSKLKKNDLNTLNKSFKYLVKDYSDSDGIEIFKRRIINITNIVGSVRNNIFHGSKGIIKMIETEQRDRLMFYSNFINSLNEQFFKVISDNVYIDLPDIKMGYNIKI